jgi:DNA-directed RNA polymerase specialized sigma24 family protein
MMSSEIPAGSVTRWLQQLEDGPASEAQQQLWARYFDRLTTVARQHLTSATRRVVDEEDVALSVLESFFAAAGQGRYPDLRDRTGLWPLLARMAVCKALKQRRHEEALKRGGGNVRGDSVFGQPNGETAALTFDEIAGSEPTPETVAELREYDRLLSSLENDSLRWVARRKLEGYANSEIALEMGVGPRTVERKLLRIRTCWSMQAMG